MATDPTQQQGTRADDITTPKEDQVGVSLYDIDEAIYRYMEDVIVPELEEDEKTLKVPILYANPERWTAIQKQGFLRDERSQLQIPLITFKRENVDKNEQQNLFSRNVTYPTIKRWSSRNRYDRFSLMTGVVPEYEAHNITMPDYVTLSYTVVMWTHYTEQMNKLIEAYSFARDNYWGDRDRFKFMTEVGGFNTEQDTADNSERIIRTTFDLTVSGYILPSKFNNRPTTKKDYTIKRVVVTTEVDSATQRVERRLNGTTEDEDVIEFLTIKSTKYATYSSDNVFVLEDVSIPIPPPQIADDYSSNNDYFDLYINGVEFEVPTWQATIDRNVNKVTFTFIFAELGFNVTQTDEVTITGKFQAL